MQVVLWTKKGSICGFIRQYSGMIRLAKILEKARSRRPETAGARMLGCCLGMGQSDGRTQRSVLVSENPLLHTCGLAGAAWAFASGSGCSSVTTNSPKPLALPHQHATEKTSPSPQGLVKSCVNVVAHTRVLRHKSLELLLGKRSSLKSSRFVHIVCIELITSC